MELPQTGQLFLGKYQLHEPLGRGGFAVVYRATDIAIGRTVAIKFLIPDGAGYEGVTANRFLREAQVLANLSDPHTLRLFDYGEADEGFLFMVTEFIEGVDLSRLLRERMRLSEEVTRHLLEQLLMALREAHTGGILHRDLKPANILVYHYLSDPHRVKLIDFGIAKPVGNHTIDSLTKTGNVVGTPRYMSPEQICSHPLEPNSDLYCLGLVAYEMFAGEPAIRGTTDKEVLLEQLRDDPIELPYLREASPELRALITKLTARRPAERFQSAQAVLDALAGNASAPPADLSTTPTPEGPDTIPTFHPPPEVLAHAHATTPTPAPPAPKPAATETSTSLALNIVVVALGTLLGGVLILGALSVLDRPDDSVARPASVVMKQAAPLPPKAREAVPDAGVPDEAAPPVAPPPVDIVQPPRDFGISASAGCGTSPPFTGTNQTRLAFGATTRSWATYVPDDYDPEQKYPVVLVFDRAVATGDPVFREFRDLARTEGIILVAPQSDDPIGPWGDDEDIDVVRAALRRTTENFCIDRDRIYAVAQGLAARFLAQKLVCSVPLSAAATGSMWMKGESFKCTPPTNVPFMYILGREDHYHPQEGGNACNGRAVLSWTQKDEAWKKRHACSGPPRDFSVHEHGHCETWTCDNAPLVRCLVEGGFYWKYIGTQLQFLLGSCLMPASIYPYAEEIWKFFQREGRPLVTQALEPDAPPDLAQEGQ